MQLRLPGMLLVAFFPVMLCPQSIPAPSDTFTVWILMECSVPACAVHAKENPLQRVLHINGRMAPKDQTRWNPHGNVCSRLSAAHTKQRMRSKWILPVPWFQLGVNEMQASFYLCALTYPRIEATFTTEKQTGWTCWTCAHFTVIPGCLQASILWFTCKYVNTTP